MSTHGNIKNIGGDPNDPHYRYKRNVIDVVYVDKKGGLTKLTNIDTIILKQLKMPVEFITAFYKQVKKKGTAMTEDGIFRGRIPVTKFEKILEKMIKRFVLCPNCGNPEWASGPVCPACGHGVAKNKKKVSDDEEVVAVSDMVATMKLDSNSTDREMADVMHSLYDKRLTVEDTSKIDKLLDAAWKTTDVENVKKAAAKLL